MDTVDMDALMGKGFDLYDVDGNGFIDKGEVVKLLERTARESGLPALDDADMQKEASVRILKCVF